jgi:hypothetical protein
VLNNPWLLFKILAVLIVLIANGTLLATVFMNPGHPKIDKKKYIPMNNQW